MTDVLQATVRVDVDRQLGPIDPRIYSGGVEHCGRSIYGGLYEKGTLKSDEDGYRLDVVAGIQELRVPIVRYPGGSFAATYHWRDGVEPVATHPVRRALAFQDPLKDDETNEFGTDEFMQWCKIARVEPALCINLGTDTLQSALDWIEYCNGTGKSQWAELRRQNGHPEPYNVKYVFLGTDMFAEWQVGQRPAREYAALAKLWSKPLRCVYPQVRLISCGKDGQGDWDQIVLSECIEFINYHALHFDCRGPDYSSNVTSAAQIEVGIQIVQQLTLQARIAQKVAAPVPLVIEWSVWDPDSTTVGDELGAEQEFTLADAISAASILNVLVRQRAVAMAFHSELVNVASPIHTTPEGIWKQTPFFPMKLFGKYMRGIALDLSVTAPQFTGPTSPFWLQSISPTELRWLDSSASWDPQEHVMNLMLVNRHPTSNFSVQVVLGDRQCFDKVEVWEIYAPDATATNTSNKQDVMLTSREESFVRRVVSVKAHSIQLVRIGVA